MLMIIVIMILMMMTILVRVIVMIIMIIVIMMMMMMMVIIVIIIIMMIITMTFTGTISDFLQCPFLQRFSNTYTQVARAQSRANHVQHISCLSRSTCCVPHGRKRQLSC